MKTQVNIKTNISLLVIIILINTLSVPHTGNKGVGLFNPCTESYPIQMITIRTQTTCTHTRPLTHTHITGILIGGQSKKYCLLPGLTVQHNEFDNPPVCISQHHSVRQKDILHFLHKCNVINDLITCLFPCALTCQSPSECSLWCLFS